MKTMSILLDSVSRWEAPYNIWRWSLLSIVAAAVERKVGVKYMAKTLYPNLSVVLIGDTATRKSTVLAFMVDLLEQSGYSSIIKDTITHRDLCKALVKGTAARATKKADGQVVPDDLASIDSSFSMPALVKADVDSIFHPEPIEDIPTSSAFLFADEFAEMFYHNRGGNNTLTLIQSLWNCPPIFETQVGTITKPCINLLAATNTSKINNVFVDLTALQGFISRTILVSADPTGRRFSPWDVEFPVKTSDRILEVLDFVSKVSGYITFNAEAQAFLAEIRDNIPLALVAPDMRLHAYASRREIHLIKTAMLLALSDMKMVVDLDCVKYAHTLLAYTETFMATGLGEYGKAENAELMGAITEALQLNPEGLTRQSLAKRVKNFSRKSTDLNPAIAVMIQTGRIQETGNQMLTLTRSGLQKWKVHIGRYVFPELIKEWGMTL